MWHVYKQHYNAKDGKDYTDDFLPGRVVFLCRSRKFQDFRRGGDRERGDGALLTVSRTRYAGLRAIRDGKFEMSGTIDCPEVATIGVKGYAGGFCFFWMTIGPSRCVYATALRKLRWTPADGLYRLFAVGGEAEW
ncbi:MAG: hypothetical protein ACLU30_03005 [Odoribacter splanchnicus]